MDQFDVYVAGFEVNEARATRGMMQAFGLGEAAARIFVQSVPRMAKRRISAEAAERYVRALRSVGAVVDCRPSQPSGYPPSGRPSLPAPGPSMVPAQGESLRASGAPSQRTSIPPAPMPSIPRAPRLPQNLAPRPASSDYPADLGPATSSQTSPVKLELMGPGSVPDPRSSPLPERAYARSDNVGRPHLFTPTRPGSSIAPLGVSFAAPKLAWYENSTNRWLVICVALATLSYTYSSGAFRTHRSELEDAWSAAGIRSGDYDEIRHFLGRAKGSFEGLSQPRLAELLEGLERAGATRIWAIEIDRRGSSQSAHTLLVELPRDPAARRTIFFQHARGANGAEPPEDTGQSFLRIAF